jgi:hypothetical protein
VWLGRLFGQDHLDEFRCPAQDDMDLVLAVHDVSDGCQRVDGVMALFLSHRYFG